jgi:pyridoxamine 5'-phosphate oxidase
LNKPKNKLLEASNQIRSLDDMARSDILAAIKNVPVASVATIEANEPRVRVMEIFRVDETGITFYTAKIKEVFKQLSQNPSVEICIYDEKAQVQVRLRGRMEQVEDIRIKKEIMAARPFVKGQRTEEEALKGMAVFKLKKGKAALWTMAAAANPMVFAAF